jgi:hypothetical protein
MRRALLAAVAGLALAAPSAQAAQFDVTTTLDAPGVCVDGACPTLRAALDAAAGTAETDTIRLPAGDYALLSDLTVPAGVTITGASARTTTVHGAVLSVAGDATIGHLTTGALSNDGTLRLDRVHASGIVNHASLTLTLSLVDGGVTSDGTLTASDSTFALSGGSTLTATAGTLTRVTVAGNVSFGNGMHVGGSLLTACGPLGPVSDGGNLVPFGCLWAGDGDRRTLDPKLGAALVNAGGETDVLRLGLGSDAIGQAGACTGTDQRELARPQGAFCDAGAYEAEVVQLTGPADPTRMNVATFTFTAAPGSTFHCKLDGDEDACVSPFVSPALADGAHTFTVQAFDGATAVSEPVTRTFTVDTVEPTIQLTGPPPLGRLDHVSFAFTASEDVTFACKLDGGAFAGCASPKEYLDLDDGSHTFTVHATDAAGNATDAAETFAINTVNVDDNAPAAPQIDSPAEGSAQRPTTVTPAYRKTVVLRPQAGHTLIKRSGDAAFTEIRSRTAVPVGTAVNVKQGAVVVIAATATGTETAKFSGGVFTASGTTLTLSEKLRCGHTRRLTGDGAGAFRIRGRYASATGRGANSTVQDTCKQTRISVTRGVVAVLDNRRPKTILIRSSRSYTARPKR